jgi:hypothetical protein
MIRYNPFDWSIDSLADKGHPERRTNVFERPHLGIWQDEKDIVSAETILQQLSADNKTSFLRCCLASCLLASKPDPNITDWLKNQIDSLSAFGLPFSWDDICQIKWVRVPVALADLSNNSSGGKIVYTLIGAGAANSAGKLWPEWGDVVLAEDARESITCVAACVSKHSAKDHLFFWPQINNTSVERGIRGASIGLPLYLASLSLVRDTSIPDILCTGALSIAPLSGNPTLTPVKSLTQKKTLAEQFVIRAFMFPQDSFPVPRASQTCEDLAAQCLKHAEDLWFSYVPEYGKYICAFLAMLDNPLLLLRNLSHIPDSLIPLSPYLHGRILDVLHGLFSGPAAKGVIDALNTLVNELRHEIDHKPNWNRAKFEAVLSLFDDRIISNIADSYSMRHAFNLSYVQLVKANHCGQISASRSWGDKAYVYYQKMREEGQTESDEELFLLLINSVLIVMHNAFEFTGRIPENFKKETEKARRKLESDYKKKKHDGHISKLLGKYYGTLVQHHSFCGGEKNLRTAEEYSSKARNAFGERVGSPPNDNCLRQYSYLICLYLELKDHVNAEKILCTYLKCNSIESIELDGFKEFEENPFQPNSLARFLAQTGRKQAYFQQWAKELMRRPQTIPNPIPNQHPWQLWLYNMGNIEDEMELKRDYWLQSFKYCDEYKQNLTINIMGLLPLAALHEHGLADSVYLEENTRKTVEVVSHPDIFQKHFKKLLSKGDDWEKVLKFVSKNKARLFPFTYR